MMKGQQDINFGNVYDRDGPSDTIQDLFISNKMDNKIRNKIKNYQTLKYPYES